MIGRGIEKKYIFEQKKDKEEFHARLKHNLTQSSLKCYAWCIMGNHFHLLLQTGKTRLPDFMKRLMTGYAIYYNKRHKRVGHLFQNRYKSTVCDKEAYLLSLVRYIHLNPVQAGILEYKELRGYEWTGHREVLEDLGEESVIDRGEILGYLGGREKESVERYKDYVKEGMGEKENYEGGGLFRSGGGKRAVAKRKQEEYEMYDDRILGKGEFVEGVLEKIEDVDRKTSKIKDIDELMAKVGKHYAVDVEMITGSREKRVREARDLVVYLGRENLGLTITAIGRILGIQQGSASDAWKRGRALKDRENIEKKVFC